MVVQEKGRTVHADPWLIAFSNIGFDDGNPRPPTVKFKQSRFLGLDARQRGYALDLDREYEVVEGAGPWGGDLVMQKYRGVAKYWSRLKRGSDTAMLPLPDRPEAPLTWGRLLGFTKEFPPRPIMPALDCWPLWRMFQVEKGAGEMDILIPLTPESSAALEVDEDMGVIVVPLTSIVSEQVLERLLHVRNAARLFLEAIYTLRSVHATKVDDALVILCYATIHAQVASIAAQCLSDTTSPLSRPEAIPRSFSDDILIRKAYYDTYHSVFVNRAPIWLELMDGLESRYVSDALPGIAWAEIMNFFYDRPGWDLLRMCGWCGRFFTAPPAERGRPREFCFSSCRKRFHDYGPHDRRTARITQ